MFQFSILGSVLYRVNTQTGDAWRVHEGVWYRIPDSAATNVLSRPTAGTNYAPPPSVYNSPNNC